MIVKIVEKERVEAGEYFHEMFVEADRIEIQFQPDQSGYEDADWTYTDQRSIELPAPAFIIRCWAAYPANKYEVGIVRSGRIYLINDSGKTIDRFVI